MRLTTAIATAALLSACAGPPWPAKVTSLAVTNAPHGTVDVLPLDLELWTEPGYDADVEELRGTAEAKLTNSAVEALTRHAYSVDALIDANGDYSGGHALDREAVTSTLGALAHYGSLPEVEAGLLPAPFLPARLGTRTGADATLYIGGWGYIAAQHESTANKIAEGVAIALVVVAVVAIVVAIASAADSKHHEHEHHRDHRAGAHGDGGGGVSVRSSPRRGGGSHVEVDASAAVDMVDAFGRVAVDALATTHPDWSGDPELPHEGDSQMYLEMTLVDNHTGRVVWHAHQQFPASAASGDDVERAANALLATLPAT